MLILFVFGTMMYFRPATMATDCGGDVFAVASMLSESSRVLRGLSIALEFVGADVRLLLLRIGVDPLPLLILAVLSSFFGSVAV